MPEVLTRIQQQFSNFWKDLDKSQRTRILIISGILAASIVAGILLLAKTSYAPLYNGKDATELQQMKNVLDGGKYKSRIVGNTLQVDSSKTGPALNLLEQKGYPKNPDTIFADAFSKFTLSDTQSDKTKRLVDASARNIAGRLKLIDYIEDASVTLAVPETQVFLLPDEKEIKPTASVMIKPRRDLSADQIHAVVMMVARSVENLDPKDITIVDFNLNELTNDTGDASIDKANNQYALKKQLQSDMESDVKKLFNGQYTSFDHMNVVASPKIFLDENQSDSKTYVNPSGTTDPSILSSSSKETNLVNADGTVSSPGVGANPGTSYQVQANANGTSTFKEKETTVNNLYNETQTHFEASKGDIIPDQSTFAVNLQYGVKAKDVPQQEIDNIKQMISGATRIPVNNITVNKFKLVPPEVVKVPVTDVLKGLFKDYGTFALIIFLAIGLMIAALPKRRKEEEDDDELLEPLTATSGGPRFIVPENSSDPIPEIGLEERSEVKKQIDKFVKQKPDAVAQLLRNWLSDEWDS